MTQQQNNTSANNKRIAKNSFYLYLRMFITMWITLYTSRFLLEVLGVKDFGVYTVVGGIAVLFSFISSTLLLSSERYIASAIAKGESKHIKNVFSTCMNCHLLISIILIVLTETIGLWLLNTKINIPDDRIVAANYVFQFSVLYCIIGVVNCPFHACIVAYERFDYNAFEGIISTILKLLILVLVYYSSFDKLIYYAALFALLAVIQICMNFSYCRYKFSDIRYSSSFDFQLFKDILKFSGWNMLKNGSFICFNQGSNIGFNIFGGVVVNAAFGVSSQVYGACMTFMHNVQSAFYPQIIKTCAAKEYDSMFLLTRRAAKFSLFMILFIGIPLVLNIDYILKLWLGNVPEYANQFACVIVFVCFLEAIYEPLNTALMANGKIGKYTTFVSVAWVVLTAALFISLFFGVDYYLCLALRLAAQIAIILLCCRLLKSYIGFPYKTFIYKECLPIILIITISLASPYFIMQLLDIDGLLKLISSTLISWFFIICTIFLFGLSKSEISIISQIIKSKLLKQK